MATIAMSEAELARLVAAGRVTVGPAVRLGPPPAPAPDVPEEDFQDAVIELAHSHGWKVAHFRKARTAKGWRTAVAADGKGFTDLLLVRERVLFRELKSEAGTLSAEQRDWRDWLRAAGQDWAVWRPSQWAEVAETLGRPCTS